MAKKFLDQDGVSYLWSKIDSNYVKTINLQTPVNGNVTINVPTVTNSYSASGTDAVSGQAVAEGLNTILDGATFTGEITAPKFITSTGLEIY